VSLKAYLLLILKSGHILPWCLLLLSIHAHVLSTTTKKF